MCRQTLQQYLLQTCFLEALRQRENGNHTRMSRFLVKLDVLLP